MHEALWALSTGFALGMLFYGGLWWTVRHASEFRRPALTVLLSALLRMLAVLAGFYLVAAQDWRRMLLCLLGFVIARLVVTWATGPRPAPPGEPRHAP